ncbi:MAG: hypothetical protein KatS3mg114_0715 [Planctomycetaceae bacterium]|nr:MAG: hypothetical protein KatS3mg114_0715 [Planctomycetaceae bacterium]
MPRRRIRRSQLKTGEILCQYCTARCCRYFALPIDPPTTWDEFDTCRWFLMHRQTAIFVDEGTWYLAVYTSCKHVTRDHRCSFYPQRPQICRQYSPDHCEYDNDGCHDKLFECAEQLWEYAEAVLPAGTMPVHLRPPPASELPIVSLADLPPCG